MIPTTPSESPPEDSIEVPIELPAPLLQLFRAQAGDLCRLLGRALSLGLTEEARPPEAVPSDAPDPSTRRQQSVANLLYFFRRYWYLAVSVARLQAEVNRLEADLEAIAGPPADAELIEKAKQDFAPPPLVRVVACTDPSLLSQATRLFAGDGAAEPAAVAIAFGAGLVLLERMLAEGDMDELRTEIARYSTSAATLHFRAYTLRYDRQILGFHLAARRAQIGL
jgi:hypothetical protein